MHVRCFPLGVLVAKECERISLSVAVGSTRGVVDSFTASSRRRLRKFLVSKFVPDSKQFGITLTIPKCDLPQDLICSRFRDCLHRFRTYFLRRYPKFGFVWRVELQCSRMPHLHLIVYGDCIFSGDVFALWFSSVRGLFPIPSYSDFSRHGVCLQVLDGNIRAYRYICDHGSKSKQAQLGWRGRQWGVVGRGNFADMCSADFYLDGPIEHMFFRFLARVGSRSIPAKCVFGSRILRRKALFSVMYCTIETCIKWMRYHGISPQKKN